MKKTLPVYPFLIALYPIVSLYSRNPGEIPAQVILRPIICALLITGIFMAILIFAFRDPLKAALISAIVVFYFSSSGHVYRIIKGYFFPNSNFNFHPMLLIIELLVILIIADKRIWKKYIPSVRITSITRYLNLVTILILLYPAVIITQFMWATRNDRDQPWTQLIEEQGTPQSLRVTESPDIYLIVLDGYGRSDVLDRLYGTDNSYFLDELIHRGFYIAEKSHSNYVQTPLSFSSFLNFAYVNFTTNKTSERSVNRLPLMDLINGSRAIELLGNAGYQLISTDSGFQFTQLLKSDVYLSPFSSGLSSFERFFLSTTALDAFSASEGPVSHWILRMIHIPGYDTHREGVLFSLDALKNQIPFFESPKFVVVHIVSPHPPFVLDKAGNSIIPNRPYLPGDGEAFGGNSREYQRHYAEQLEYINARTLLAIDSILAESTTPPIIILQGDHGPGSLLRRDNINDTCIWERSSILNAYYMPEYNNTDLYPEITPVNTFRVIFNTYFGTDFELLPDRTYFSPQSYPYDFTDVTAQSNMPCANSQ